MMRKIRREENEKKRQILFLLNFYFYEKLLETLSNISVPFTNCELEQLMHKYLQINKQARKHAL